MTKSTKKIDRRFCVAPMLDCTDRHDRYFLRLISRHSVMYTEMITTGALIFGDRKRFLDFDKAEHPIALQLGGSEPDAMTQCAEFAQEWNYDEVNINVGCPSDRVQSGSFGACLMQTPELVAENVKRMSAAVDIPVTVKSRIGVDDQEPREALWKFVEIVANAGCNVFHVHARKAWLKGLSPKENRDVPPLDYELVYELKQAFPELEIIINGGIKTIEECQTHMQYVDGVMVGREGYIEYCDKKLQEGYRLNELTRHIVGLYHAQPKSRLWRRYLSENAHKAGSGIEVIEQARERLYSV